MSDPAGDAAASHPVRAPGSLGPPRVIYVMGSGRSGSTVLGVTLGNCEGIFYAGELDTWLARSGEPILGGLERTRFWRDARELQAMEGIELHLVFLYRDPESVVASFARLVKRQDVAERRLRELSTNVNLWITHLLSVLVFVRQPRERRMLLHHEDFLADPEGVIRDVLRRVGSSAPMPDLESLRTGYPLKGNRLIRSETIAVRGRTPTAPRRSRVTALAQLPWTLAVARLEPVAGSAGRRRESAGTASGRG